MAAERENFAAAFANELSKAIYQGPTRAADNEPDISELKKLSSSLFDALMDRYDVVSFLMTFILVAILPPGVFAPTLSDLVRLLISRLMNAPRTRRLKSLPLGNQVKRRQIPL
jgi:hypothetical protein